MRKSLAQKALIGAGVVLLLAGASALYRAWAQAISACLVAPVTTTGIVCGGTGNTVNSNTVPSGQSGVC